MKSSRELVAPTAAHTPSTPMRSPRLVLALAAAGLFVTSLGAQQQLTVPTQTVGKDAPGIGELAGASVPLRQPTGFGLSTRKVTLTTGAAPLALRLALKCTCTNRVRSIVNVSVCVSPVGSGSAASRAARSAC